MELQLKLFKVNNRGMHVVKTMRPQALEVMKISRLHLRHRNRWKHLIVYIILHEQDNVTRLQLN